MRTHRLLSSKLEELVERVDLDTSRLQRLYCVLLDVFLGTIVHYNLDSRRLLDDGGDGREEVGVREHSVNVGLGERVLELYDRKGQLQFELHCAYKSTYSFFSKRVVGGREGDTLRCASYGWTTAF